MEGNENEGGKGGMWALQQKLDQPMDEEASRLKNMHTESVINSFFYSLRFSLE